MQATWRLSLASSAKELKRILQSSYHPTAEYKMKFCKGEWPSQYREKCNKSTWEHYLYVCKKTFFQYAIILFIESAEKRLTFQQVLRHCFMDFFPSDIRWKKRCFQTKSVFLFESAGSSTERNLLTVVRIQDHSGSTCSETSGKTFLDISNRRASR